MKLSNQNLIHQNDADAAAEGFESGSEEDNDSDDLAGPSLAEPDSKFKGLPVMGLQTSTVVTGLQTSMQSSMQTSITNPSNYSVVREMTVEELAASRSMGSTNALSPEPKVSNQNQNPLFPTVASVTIPPPSESLTTNFPSSVLVLKNIELACGVLNGTKAQGLKLDAEEIHAYVTNRPSSLAQTRLVLPANRANSAPLSHILASLGFAHVLELRHSRVLWRKEGLPAVANSGPTLLTKSLKLNLPPVQNLDVGLAKVRIHLCSDTIQTLLSVAAEGLATQKPMLKDIKDSRVSECRA